MAVSYDLNVCDRFAMPYADFALLQVLLVCTLFSPSTSRIGCICMLATDSEGQYCNRDYRETLPLSIVKSDKSVSLELCSGFLAIHFNCRASCWPGTRIHIYSIQFVDDRYIVFKH